MEANTKTKQQMLRMSKANQLKPDKYESTQYDLFNTEIYNRPLTKQVVSRIMENMRASGFWDSEPIIVRKNGTKWVVVDGHHRFAAAYALGIPIKFQVEDSGDALRRLIARSVTQHPWPLKDLVALHARSGNANYCELMDYAAETGIGVGQCAAIFLGRVGSLGDATPAVRLGDFAPSPIRLKDDVARIVCHVTDLLGKPFATRAGFVYAVTALCSVDLFDVEHAVGQITKRHGTMKPIPGRDENLLQLERVYNHGSRSGLIPLANLAVEVARSRRLRRMTGPSYAPHPNDRYA